MIPTEEECLKLLDEHNPMVKKHSILVKELALKVADIMSLNGIEINRDLLVAGALLHDIKKTFGYDEHDVRGEQFLTQLGYPEVGKIARKHFFESNPKTYEEKIVFMVDKMCNPGQTVVTFDERFKYIKQQYGNDDKTLSAWMDELLEIQNELLGDDGERLLQDIRGK